MRNACRVASGLLIAAVAILAQPANAASLGVAEAVGFHREGLLRSFMHVGGERRDMLMYSLLPDDPD